MRTVGSRLLPGRRFNAFLLSGLMLAGALGAGCSRHQPAASASPAANASLEASAPSPPTRGPGPMAPPAVAPVVPDTGDINATLGQLSLELRKYVVRTRSVPK